jgi:MbtH protein
MNDEESNDRTYRVVVNDEEQYSIWDADRELPAGWYEEGTTGTKAQCLEHIDRVWVDMRPKSLRIAMEEAEQKARDENAG